MAEKLVFRNAEERKLWRGVFASVSDPDVSHQCASEEADMAVESYRDRCGSPVADDARLAGCWLDLVGKLPKEAFADQGADEYPVDAVDAIVRNFNRLLAERDEARRDRDVLGDFIRNGGDSTNGEPTVNAALSRCTPAEGGEGKK